MQDTPDPRRVDLRPLGAALEAPRLRPHDPLLITAEEAGRALSIGRSKIYELMRSGELPSVRIGSCRRVDIGELARFVERHRSGVA